MTDDVTAVSCDFQQHIRRVIVRFSNLITDDMTVTSRDFQYLVIDDATVASCGFQCLVVGNATVA